MRQWNVAGAILEDDMGLLLVHNQRRTGVSDWSPPGGVIDHDDADVHTGLAREVWEETGLTVAAWGGLCYEVHATAPELGWEMRCEVHYAAAYSGQLVVDDPDGIVVDAAFFDSNACRTYLQTAMQWVREPLEAWLEQRWEPGFPRRFAYSVLGSDPSSFRVVRDLP
ncbi:MAG: NUDIX hydrolase [Acidimicrobiia bacterium]